MSDKQLGEKSSNDSFATVAGYVVGLFALWVIYAFVIMISWNLSFPTVFDLHKLTFTQSFGFAGLLMVLRGVLAVLSPATVSAFTPQQSK